MREMDEIDSLSVARETSPAGICDVLLSSRGITDIVHTNQHVVACSCARNNLIVDHAIDSRERTMSCPCCGSGSWTVPNSPVPANQEALVWDPDGVDSSVRKRALHFRLDLRGTLRILKTSRSLLRPLDHEGT